jgi:hypothetical protein
VLPPFRVIHTGLVCELAKDALGQITPLFDLRTHDRIMAQRGRVYKRMTDIAL